MTRCVTYRDRPSQADMLHLDIWRDGVNLACDPGTYRYYDHPPWNNGLVSTQVHNTVGGDGADQMARGPRFLWLSWVESRLFHHLTSPKGGLGYFEGAHEGYSRLEEPVVHRRAVLQAGGDLWVVVDDMTGDGEHELRLHWLLDDLPFEVDEEKRCVYLQTGSERYAAQVALALPADDPGTFSLLRGTEESAPRGWRSSYYGVRQPVLSVALCVEAQLPVRFVTIFAPEDVMDGASLSDGELRLRGPDVELTARLLPPRSSSIIQDAALTGSTGQDRLVVE